MLGQCGNHSRNEIKFGHISEKYKKPLKTTNFDFGCAFSEQKYNIHGD